MRVIKALRTRSDLAKELLIDPIKIGRQICKLQAQKEEVVILPDVNQKENSEYEPSEEEAKKAFNATIAKLESVRNISSPILKVI